MQDKKTLPLISVIMPSFLGEYEGAASNREDKFIRAVDSFLEQTYPNKELIVISDGCKKTEELVKEEYFHSKEVILLTISKRPLFSGSVRQTGLEFALGSISCYLDTDDTLKTNHLENIANAFLEDETLEWVYFDNLLIYKEVSDFPVVRETAFKYGWVGTSNVAHLTSLKENGLTWEGCDGYGHDFMFINNLQKFHKYKKIDSKTYYVCHSPGIFDH